MSECCSEFEFLLLQLLLMKILDVRKKRDENIFAKFRVRASEFRKARLYLEKLEIADLKYYQECIYVYPQNCRKPVWLKSNQSNMNGSCIFTSAFKPQLFNYMFIITFFDLYHSNSNLRCFILFRRNSILDVFLNDSSLIPDTYVRESL